VAVAVTALRDLALEAAIAERPDERGGYEVYADWLDERGDPRGEWIHVQLATEDRPGDAELRQREQDLLATHEAEWLGRLSSSGYWPTVPIQVAWRRGFVHRAEVRTQYETEEAALIYRELAALPAAALLRELRASVACSYGGGGDDDSSLIEALRDRPLPTLRVLELDPFEFQLSWTHVGDLSRANAALARLEALTIGAGRITLGAIDLPELRRLRLESGGLRAHVLASLAAARWPALETLEVFLGTSEYGGTCTPVDVMPILAGATLPLVTRLALCNGTFGDELAVAATRAPILSRLRALDLSLGTMGADGAAAIVEHAVAFAHLDELDLSENYIPDAACERLRAVLPNAKLAGQRHEDEYGRFVSVSE
jgi:uncharacterized protein (TIGR02996 family)